MGISPRRVGRTFNRAVLPVPKNGAELEEMLSDPARMKDVLADGKSFSAFVQEYANAQQGDGTELNRRIADETQRVFAEMLKNNGMEGGKDAIRRLNLDPQSGNPANMLTSHRQATAYNKAAPGAKIDGKFANATDYIKTIWHLNQTAEAQAQRMELMNAYSSGSSSDGGFLVPETLRSQLLQIALEQSVVRPRATVVPMESARVPFPMIDSTTNAGSVMGGMTAYWGEEGANLTDSSGKFGRVVLDAKKLTGLSAVPNELLADSAISFAALIETLWPQALAFFEDAAFQTGTGVGEPLGYSGSNNAAGVAITKEVGQPAASIVIENIVKMYSRMLPSSLSRAVWTCSPEAIPELFTLALSVGTGGSPMMLANVVGAAPMTIFGRPLIVTEKSQRLGTRGDLAFVDLSYYLVGDRQTMSASSSTDFNFGSDKTTFRIIQRVDGQPWLKSAITPQNGGPALSPFVEIENR
jgi:HK97 family phage major capsid protein